MQCPCTATPGDSHQELLQQPLQFPSVSTPPTFTMATKFLAAALALMATTCTSAFDNPSSVELFRDADFEGRSVEVGTTEPSFPFAFNDRVSSLIVRGGPWMFYTSVNFNGEVAILEPGVYPTAAETELPDDSISSMRPFPPPTAASILIFQVRLRTSMMLLH